MSQSDLIRLQGARVLVVEGHDDTRELNRTILALRGADVRIADSAETAMQLLGYWPPDAVLTDLRLPGTSAFALMDEVRARAGDRIPVVGTSTDSRPEARARALGRGVFAYLTKPVEPDEICVALARALGQNPRSGPYTGSHCL